jgi:uncharacterized protein YbaA (DUF1428 family)
MTYIEGFIAAVPETNRQRYQQHAADAATVFAELGVRRIVECWQQDVPDGKDTDFRRAVQAADGEAVVFSWFEYPDRSTRDAVNEKMRADPRMERLGAEMPFDGRRMIIGGFEGLVEERDATRETGYVDGFVLPVPEGNRDAYRQLASAAAEVFLAHGATRVVEAWGNDVPDGKVTDYRRAVKAQPGENVVYSFIEWPSRAVRDSGWEQSLKDPRMQDMPKDLFDGKRMFWGGFDPILDRR